MIRCITSTNSSETWIKAKISPNITSRPRYCPLCRLPRPCPSHPPPILHLKCAFKPLHLKFIYRILIYIFFYIFCNSLSSFFPKMSLIFLVFRLLHGKAGHSFLHLWNPIRHFPREILLLLRQGLKPQIKKWRIEVKNRSLSNTTNKSLNKSLKKSFFKSFDKSFKKSSFKLSTPEALCPPSSPPEMNIKGTWLLFPPAAAEFEAQRRRLPLCHLLPGPAMKRLWKGL